MSINQFFESFVIFNFADVILDFFLWRRSLDFPARMFSLYLYHSSLITVLFSYNNFRNSALQTEAVCCYKIFMKLMKIIKDPTSRGCCVLYLLKQATSTYQGSFRKWMK